jgi:hypothetical protein
MSPRKQNFLFVMMILMMVGPALAGWWYFRSQAVGRIASFFFAVMWAVGGFGAFILCFKHEWKEPDTQSTAPPDTDTPGTKP